MKKIFFVIALFALLSSANANDKLMQAMRDEMKRSMDQLKLDGLEKPYYIEYKIVKTNSYKIKSSLGKVIESDPTVVAELTVGVRVGDYKFDNSNFFDIGLSFFGSGDDEERYKGRRISTEPDYFNVRRELWLATDAAYKQAAEIYSKKQASLKNKVRKDTTHDLLIVKANRTIDTSMSYSFDIEKHEQLINAVSKVFASYSEISVSNAMVEFLPETVYYINSEGMEYIRRDVMTGLEVSAFTQAEDGMGISDSYSVYTKNPNDLPSQDSLIKAIKMMADNIKNTASSKSIDEPYSGPIIFSGQAATELIAQVFAPNLVAQRQPIMEGGFTDGERFAAFQNKVGGRVLPEFLSVEAKPNLNTIANSPLVGYYDVDDDGVLPKDVKLVEKGYLRSLLSSRVPTRRIRETNGHNRGGSAMLSNIIFSAYEKQATYDELKKQLIKLVKDRELPYGIIIKKIQNQNILMTGLYGLTYGAIEFPRGTGKLMINEAYKVFPDGREEVFRGGQLSGVSAQSFKDIINVGKKPIVMNYLAPSVTSSFISGGAGYIPSSIVAFDLLFEDAEVKSPEGDFNKPPFVSKP